MFEAWRKDRWSGGQYIAWDVNIQKSMQDVTKVQNLTITYFTTGEMRVDKIRKSILIRI